MSSRVVATRSGEPLINSKSAQVNNAFSGSVCRTEWLHDGKHINMVTVAKPRKEGRQQDSGAGYRGRQARTGNSLGLRFDRALFKSHPEFAGEVRAHVIAPGRMLVVAEPMPKAIHKRDPVLEAFLSFLAADMVRAPQQIRPLDENMMQRIGALVEHVSLEVDEELGDESLL